VHEQLGLKLVSAKASIEVTVIDHIGKPSENALGRINFADGMPTNVDSAVSNRADD
jgi:hypothetical protein